MSAGSADQSASSRNTAGGAEGKSECAGGLRLFEAPEEAEFEDAGELEIPLAQALERAVDVEQPLWGRGLRGQPSLVQLLGRLARAALPAQSGASAVHEYLAHDAGRHRHEMVPVLELHAVTCGQL